MSGPHQCLPDRSVERHYVIRLAAVAFLLYFVNLGKVALANWDEAIYAEVSKEIVTSHHWLSLSWQHQLFAVKPPLTLWISAAFFKVFGVSAISARVESALAGIAVVLLTYALARRTSDVRAALFAAFVLLTTRHFDDMARQGMMDIPLTLCVYLAVYAYVRLRSGPTTWFYVLCAAIGAGAMVKGPAILIAPLAIGIDCFLRKKTERRLGWREYSIGSLILVAIVVPWHAWMFVKYGSTFFHEYVGHQLLARATQVQDEHSGGILFYLQTIAHGAFPWSVMILIAAFRWIKNREWQFSLPWILALVTLLLYTLIPTKMPQYIVPVYPALALEVGRLLSKLSESRRIVQYLCVGVLAIGMVVAFEKFAVATGDPVANQMAQLAGIAKHSPAPGPLLILSRPGSQPEIDVPTAVFYSDRPALNLEIPEDDRVVTDAIRAHASVDAILPNSELNDLSKLFEVRPIAQTDLLSYVVISRKR
jgi:4-amino-4-deoxy-L-arabinose transferase-like glycosyltransferase